MRPADPVIRQPSGVRRRRGGALGVFQESEKGQLPLVSSKVPYRILAIDIAVGREILYPRLERR